MHKLEIACFNLQSAIIAQQGGADRIELCDDLAAGGITPNYGTYEAARKLITIDLFAMIRPRGGNFIYSDNEFTQMKKDILHFKKMNVNGFVFGILDQDANVNKDQNKDLIKLAGSLPCTFHRAFDIADDPEKALEDIIDCGFQSVLTSGQKKSAVQGKERLLQLSASANGRIEIMPGGGIRSSNIQLLKENLDTTYYHSSAIIQNDLADFEEVRLLKKILSE